MTLDYCHAFHLGSGIDLGASTTVLLAKLDLFGNDRALDIKLRNGFADFIKWCHDNGRVTSLAAFSKQDFDMTSNLALHPQVRFVVCNLFWKPKL